MIRIEKKMNGNELMISIEGRLDYSTSPELEKELTNMAGIDKVVFNFEKLEYISSSGLALILKFKKLIDSIRIINCSKEVYEIFNIAGFSEIMDVEKM